MSDAAPTAAPAWHALSGQEVLQKLGSAHDAGLTSAEAARRLAQYGANQLRGREARRSGVLWRLARQFHNTLLYVLLAAAVLTAALGHWLDAGVVAAVVLLNAAIGFVQEGKAERALAVIRRLVALQAVVLRDGAQHALDAALLVPGDAVLLAAGDQVPADVRVLRAHALHVDESALTGESVPVGKHAAAVTAVAELGDRRCMAYAGTVVTAGQALAVVVATGGTTELGRIGQLLDSVDYGTTPLIRSMAVFGRWLTALVVGLAVLLVLVGFFARHMPLNDVMLAAVAVAVAAIPEGLPAIMTITLAIGVQRMSHRNAIVRRLPAVETLGAVTVICSDKTGTLTRNEMTVQRVYTASDPPLDLSATSDSVCCAEGDTGVFGAQPACVQALVRIAALCNDASMRSGDNGQRWHTSGDPMEVALLALALKLGANPEQLLVEHPRLEVIPFDSRSCYMATLHAITGSQSMALVKGAPERIFAMCQPPTVASESEKRRRNRHNSSRGRQLAQNGRGTEPFAAQKWRDIVDVEARAGRRVLAFAQRDLPQGQRDLVHVDVEHSLTFVGLVSIMDPPRAEAIAAIRKCHTAGIRVIMITGDHGVTARAIGAELELCSSDARIVVGAELDALSDAEFRNVVQETNVFARVSPEHKLRIVAALKSRNQVVAMTGDGVNDAPALKRSDVGVAMGKKGTEVAKQAAAIVLSDDNFATVASAVEEGRTIFDKLVKTVAFILPLNGGESLVILAAVVLGEPLPIQPVHILWVNMVSSVGLALALAFEHTEANVMHRPPRAPTDSLLSARLVWRVAFVALLLLAGVFGLYEWSQRRGDSVATSNTVAVNTLVSSECFYLLSVRRLNAPLFGRRPFSLYTLVALVCVYALQALFTFAPFMQKVFRTGPIDGLAVLLILACSFGVLILVELEKAARLLIRTWRQRRRADALSVCLNELDAGFESC